MTAAAGKGSAGWAIVALALIIPGVMFYAWWSHLNAASKAQMTQRVRKRLPGGASLFTGAPAEEKLTNPIAGEGEAQAQAEAQPAVPASTAAGGGATPAAAPGAAPAAGEAAGAQPGTAAAAAPTEPAAVVPAAPGGPVFLRDPMLSPYDLVRIEQAALEKNRSTTEVRHEAAAIRSNEPPIENSIEIQGIITDAEGRHRAIVNGELVSVGDLVGAAKVARITPRSVVFTHRNRRFTKTMSR